MMKTVFILATVFLFSAISSANMNLATVPGVDLNRYSGTWYEIARFPFRQQEGCRNTTATYTLREDETIKVENRCVKAQGQSQVPFTAVGTAMVGEEKRNSKLQVRFFTLAPWSDYWIIRLGTDYEYAVVSQPERRYLWILSRTPTMANEVYEDLRQSLRAEGFDVDRLQKTEHSIEAASVESTPWFVWLAPYFSSLIPIFILMSLMWILSLLRKDASLIDRVWGLGFIIIFIQGLMQSQFLTFRAALVLTLVVIWGFRLALHIHLRNRGQAEDSRYQAMRQRQGTGFWWKSYFTIFGLQGILMWLISAPLVIIHLFPQPDQPTILDGVGILLWVLGFTFETVADWQLARFKANKANRGKVCCTGLWALSRHPNYFGECLLWWGYFLIALNVDYGWSTVFSPVLMTFLLLKVSGVALLERHLSQTKPGYEVYLKEVPAFLPFRKFRSSKRRA